MRAGFAVHLSILEKLNNFNRWVTEVSGNFIATVSSYLKSWCLWQITSNYTFLMERMDKVCEFVSRVKSNYGKWTQ